MKSRLFFYILTFITSSQAWAGERYEFYNGVRMLGMGGAGVAISNDETALLVNPAGLGKLRDYYITIADPEIDIGVQTEEIVGTDILNVGKPQDMLEKALQNPDKFMHARAQVFPSVVVPNFGFGLFGRTEVNAEYVSATNTYMYDYTNDWAGVLGANFRLFNGIIKIGGNARITNHATVRRTDIDPASTDLNIKTISSEGIGIGSDAGILIAAPIAWLPTIGAVYRDVGRTNYTLRDGMFNKTATKPESTPSTLDAAIAIHPIVGKRARMTWTVEVHDVLNYSEEEVPMNLFHAGAEFNFADALFIRAGMNQSYYTAGVELAMMNYQFQAATYGENIGTATLAREDRRYVAKFSFRF